MKEKESEGVGLIYKSLKEELRKCKKHHTDRARESAILRERERRRKKKKQREIYSQSL